MQFYILKYIPIIQQVLRIFNIHFGNTPHAIFPKFTISLTTIHPYPEDTLRTPNPFTPVIRES